MKHRRNRLPSRLPNPRQKSTERHSLPPPAFLLQQTMKLFLMTLRLNQQLTLR